LRQAPRVRAVIDFLRETARSEDACFIPPYIGTARKVKAEV
jgi:hypothetical protein